MSSGRTALITGVSGQDGSYLAEALRARGFQVTGTTHRKDLADASSTVYLSLSDDRQIEDLVKHGQFDEIYNLAARASSAQLFDDPLSTADINGLAVIRFLQAVNKYSPQTRFCQASTSEIFGANTTSPYVEDSPRQPINAYAAAKAFADHMVQAYRTSHGLFACSAILFSHESPRRSTQFVVRKVCRAAAAVSLGIPHTLTLHNLDAVRDWGFAPDYVEAMRLMLQAERPRDYVVATGEAHSVRDLCEMAFGYVGVQWQDHVEVDSVEDRHSVRRIGNAARIENDLGWRPSISFDKMVARVVDADRTVLADEDSILQSNDA